MSESPATLDHPLLELQRKAGNQSVQTLLRRRGIHARLEISQPGDRYEQEADRVAQAVMNMPEAAPQREIDEREKEEEPTGIAASRGQAEAQIQRQDDLEDKKEEELVQPSASPHRDSALVQREGELEDEREEEPLQANRLQHQESLDDEEEKEEILSPKQGSGQTPDPLTDVESRIDARRGRGQPLSEAGRDFFEPRFGHDFSGVRVHADAEANTLTRALNARAFTTGKDIFFQQGGYNDCSTVGRHLLAHELAHVLQQPR